MLKYIIALSIVVSSVNASEIKLNVPFVAHHTEERAGGEKWNENFLDDGLTLGVSYMKDFVGFSYNTVAKNSYGKKRSHYITADVMPKIFEDGLFYARAGGSIGIATGYNELSSSGVIPLIGGSLEAGIGNFSIQATVIPSYKNAPSTFIGIARFQLYEW